MFKLHYRIMQTDTMFYKCVPSVIKIKFVTSHFNIRKKLKKKKPKNLLGG